MGSLFVEGLGFVIECVILYIGCECEYIYICEYNEEAWIGV